MSVHLITLGCARNEVDSEELAGRLAADGFRVVDEPAEATAILVNTCGFIDAAKKDSIDTILAAADLRDAGRVRSVVAVGCLAERYGQELAAELPEADAVLGFDEYGSIAERLRWIAAGGRHRAHTPVDRRTLLPLAPVSRPEAAGAVVVPGHAQTPPADGRHPASGPRVLRRRLGSGPTAPLKIASGCDRRCAFCAIPTFRGAYLSRPVDDVVAEARWLVGEGVREVVLVSENSSSYGKDRLDLRALEGLLGELSGVDGLEWIRVSYLQPAEMRPSLIEAIATTPKVVPYFDLPFQHASASVLRRMRRFGDPESFRSLLDRIRDASPQAGVRTNVIVGFPGETADDLAQLADFLGAARLDAIGVFGYSDEEGTEGAGLPGKVHPDEIDERAEWLSDLVEELVSQRAEDRVGEPVQVLIEARNPDGTWQGRAAHQGPDVDGTTTITTGRPLSVGDLVWGKVTASEGADLAAVEEGR